MVLVRVLVLVLVLVIAVLYTFRSSGAIHSGVPHGLGLVAAPLSRPVLGEIGSDLSSPFCDRPKSAYTEEVSGAAVRTSCKD